MPREPRKPRVDDSEKGHIPRPANCFMIFRAEWHKNLIANNPTEDTGRKEQKNVSKDAAVAWNNLSPALKEHYKNQADIVKAEHTKKYPGWTYRPGPIKGKKRVKGGSSKKRIPRTRTRQIAPDKGELETMAKPLTQAPAPTRVAWDGSWFSESALMTDPFFSEPIQPISPVHGFDPASYGHTMPSMYDPNPGSGSGGRHDLGGHGHDASRNPPSLPSHRPFVQEADTTEHLVGPGSQAVLPSRTEDSAQTPGSLTGKTPTPEPEVEPPTQALVGNFCLTHDKLLESSGFAYDKHLEGCYYNDLALDPDFDPFSLVEP